MIKTGEGKTQIMKLKLKIKLVTKTIFGRDWGVGKTLYVDVTKITAIDPTFKSLWTILI